VSEEANEGNLAGPLLGVDPADIPVRTADLSLHCERPRSVVCLTYVVCQRELGAIVRDNAEILECLVEFNFYLATGWNFLIICTQTTAAVPRFPE
jgi:hypothetical protein